MLYLFYVYENIQERKTNDPSFTEMYQEKHNFSLGTLRLHSHEKHTLDYLIIKPQSRYSVELSLRTRKFPTADQLTVFLDGINVNHLLIAKKPVPFSTGDILEIHLEKKDHKERINRTYVFIDTYDG